MFTIRQMSGVPENHTRVKVQIPYKKKKNDSIASHQFQYNLSRSHRVSDYNCSEVFVLNVGSKTN